MSERLLQQGKEIICFSQNTGDITFFRKIKLSLLWDL